MVYGEVGICSDDWWACYCQCATAINRVKTGWGNSIMEVLWQDGQYCMDYYAWVYSYDSVVESAVTQCISDWASQVPETLIYADSRETVPDGCYVYYETYCDTGTWQRFYAY